MSENHIQNQIDLITKHEEDFLARRTPAERVGDAVATFVGSLLFVSIQLLIFIAWVTWNTASISRLGHFDPPPYPLLGTLLALEAIFLASFILMRQSRMSRRAEERDHLMLQILILTEKEVTAVLHVDREIAKQLGLEQVANSPEMEQLSQHTSIEDVAQTLHDTLPAKD